MSGARLFFALWPEAEVRLALQTAVSGLPPLPGRAVRPADWHLTLAFLGPVSPTLPSCAKAVAASVRAAPFSLRLDRAGAFASAQVAWAGCAHTPASLDALVNRLHAALAACGWRPQARPFMPHVTLARQVTAPWPERPLPVVDWLVRDFVLAASDAPAAGRRYRTLARWPLRESGA